MVESVNTVCQPLSLSHMHLQWHNKDAASRCLWMETYAAALCCKSLRSAARIFKKSPANITHTPLQNHRLLFWLPLAAPTVFLYTRAWAFLHLSSHAFPGSGSPLLLTPTGCPSLDRAPASFDALLIESRGVGCWKKNVRFVKNGKTFSDDFYFLKKQRPTTDSRRKKEDSALEEECSVMMSYYFSHR